MSAVRLIVALLLVAPAVQAATVTPVEEVITLLENLESSLQSEGQSEATTYEEFACFCQNSTGLKSDSITSGQSNIEGLSAKIQLETEEKTTKQAELADRQAQQAAMAAELAAEKEAYAKEKAEYQAEAAELSQAIEGLNQAIAAMEKSKPASFLSVRPSVSKTLDLAEMMGFIAPGSQRQKAVADFLQAKVDPADPVYKFHSDNIIKVMKDVLAEFTAKKAEVDDEFEKRTTVHDEKVASLTQHMSTNSGAMSALSIDIDSLSSSIATARDDLVSAEALLKDDQLYLKDLTERCEVRAKEWDQRSQMRADELEAIAQALQILKSDVSAMDESANERALLQQSKKQAVVHAAPSFFQGPMSHARVGAHSSLIENAAKTAAATEDVARGQAMDMLASEGKKLSSAVLTSLVMRASADPFLKVKGLIQQLIERLLRESRDEATKKGFCDTELGKAKLQRDNRNAEVQKLSAETVVLKAKKAELEEEIDMLNSSIISLTANLANATAIRGEEKEENLVTVEEATKGLEAVTKAIGILKAFYKNAAKATALIQKASPVDEDTAGAGFKGNYGGKQESATGIIGLLEVIKSDFERTIRNTKASEKEAAADFVKFDRVSKADMGGKDTKMNLDIEDLATTDTNIAKTLEDLTNAQGLLDKALKEIEALKPMCIDTTMSYEKRVELRDQEIAALKNALCILDTEGVEEGCPGPAVVP